MKRLTRRSDCCVSLHQLSFAPNHLSTRHSLYALAFRLFPAQQDRFLTSLQALDAAWHVCTRQQNTSYHLLVILACFKLIGPFLPLASSESSVENIPFENLRACQILIKFHDMHDACLDKDRPSLLSMVRLVLAVRNVDSVSAEMHARDLLLPSDKRAPDPFSCYNSVFALFSSSNMTSELCDLLNALLQTFNSAHQNANVPQSLLRDTISACIKCARLLGSGGAVHLLGDHNFPEVVESIIQRAVTLRRLDVLRPKKELGNEVLAQVIACS